jgi:hypothetical protein
MPRHERVRTRFMHRPHGGTALAPPEGMHALEIEGELLASERPTIPVPAPLESGIRLKVAKVAWGAVTVDVVLCDLSRDPRSEDYLPRAASSGFFLAGSGQNERPPSTSIVRALK